MGKYIVELKKNETLYKAATRESDGTAYVCSAIGTPYTEPDLEQVRKEAYEKGWKEAEDHYEKGYNDGYDTGLEDAWKVADKIFDMSCLQREQIFSKCDSVGVWDILRKYSASEAIEKIRQYEQEQEKIKVWDEVINGRNFKGTVTCIEDDGALTIFCQDGTWIKSHAQYWRKTGRRFSEIAEVLKKMREE